MQMSVLFINTDLWVSCTFATYKVNLTLILTLTLILLPLLNPTLQYLWEIGKIHVVQKYR